MQVMLPSRRAAELASKVFAYCANQPGLIVAAVQGGLVQHAAETCLAWLRSDGFKVQTSGSTLLHASCQCCSCCCCMLTACKSFSLKSNLHRYMAALACSTGMGCMPCTLSVRQLIAVAILAGCKMADRGIGCITAMVSAGGRD